MCRLRRCQLRGKTTMIPYFAFVTFIPNGEAQQRINSPALNRLWGLKKSPQQ